MTVADVTHWAEQHPVEATVIGGGGLIALLWLLGFFGGSGNANAGASNLASAYYAAEAQQAVVGGQIQMANIAATAQTAQTTLNDTAAIAVNQANTNAAKTINGQNATSATTINQSNNDAVTAQTGIVANEQLLATYSNNSAAVAQTQSNNATAATINAANNKTSFWNTLMNLITPAELMNANIIAPSDYGALYTGPGGSAIWSPNWLQNMGFTAAQANQLGLKSAGG